MPDAADMSRRDWLLLLLGFPGRRGVVGLDPVRVQKGMFLFAKQGGRPASELYPFEPYHYGPYSFDVRRDLDQLVEDGLVVARPVEGYSWKRYQLTEQGMRAGRRVLLGAPRSAAVRLAEIKDRVTGHAFNELLRDVYRQYPDMAERSVFRG